MIDWHHPEFPVDGFHPQRDDLAFREASQQRDMRKYVEYLHGQVRELLTGYGQIDILWLDFSYPSMDWGWSKGKGSQDWQGQRLVEMVRELQPAILLNDRVGVDPDFYTPEQLRPAQWVQVDGRRVTWEACHTLNGSWGYDRDNLDWKSPELLVRMLIDTVSKGGNLLLNVGPTARGEFDARSKAILDAIGCWMRLHCRAIYRATASDWSAPADCRFTQRGNRLYVHIFAWPMQALHLPGLAGRVEYAQLLHDGSEIHLQSNGHDDSLTLTLPVQRLDVLVPVLELFLG